MASSDTLSAFLAQGEPIAGHKPWPRVRLTRAGWLALIEALGHHKDWALLGVWGEPREVHAALYDETDGAPAIASLVCDDGVFPSLSAVRPGAIRMERTVQDLVGLRAEGLTDSRPWLDHGQFKVGLPLGGTTARPVERPATTYDFLKIVGEGLHQIPVGPVHAGIIEPGHFRFTANGETVVRLEERLGYVHKGVETLMRGKSVADAARIAGRISGDSTVAYAVAFARAVEAATEINAPARAHALRGLMAEMERVANHLGDIGAICNDAAFAFMLGQCGLLREKVLTTAMACFGHRLMMDCIVPGGASVDLADDKAGLIRAMVDEVGKKLETLVEIYENKASLLDRTMTTGFVAPDLVHRFAAGGHVGRASGRPFDSRRAVPYAPYDALAFDVPVMSHGDVHARLWIRVEEVRISLKLIGQILATLPAGAVRVDVPKRSGEGVALVEAFRGELLVWLRLNSDGTIQRCHPRDASWLQWPLLEASIEGNIVADFPLCNKSFNCSYSGQDL